MLKYIFLKLIANLFSICQMKVWDGAYLFSCSCLVLRGGCKYAYICGCEIVVIKMMCYYIK